MTEDIIIEALEMIDAWDVPQEYAARAIDQLVQHLADNDLNEDHSARPSTSHRY